MDSKNCKTSIIEDRRSSIIKDLNRILLNFSDKTNWKESDEYVTLSNLSIYYSWRNKKNSYKNKFEISAQTWNDKFELPDGLYFVSDIEDFLSSSLKNMKQWLTIQ